MRVRDKDLGAVSQTDLSRGLVSSTAQAYTPFLEHLTSSKKKKNRRKSEAAYLTGWACVLSDTDGDISSSLSVAFISTRQTFDACYKDERM